MSILDFSLVHFRNKVNYIVSKNLNTDVYFDYSTEIVNCDKEFYKLDVLTKNKSHDGLFIFYRTTWSNWSKEECLRDIRLYRKD